MDALLDGYVNDGRIGGIVALVLRDGKPVYQRAVGWRDKEAGQKMTMDTIFRIASQSKALTSVAILALMEEGKLTVNDRAGQVDPDVREDQRAHARGAKHHVDHNRGKAPDHHPRPAHAHRGNQLRPAAGVRSAVRAQGPGRSRRASAGTSPTRTSPSARPWSVSGHCPSRRSPANVTCTATTPTCSAASSRKPRASRWMSTSARTSPGHSGCRTRCSIYPPTSAAGSRWCTAAARTARS